MHRLIAIMALFVATVPISAQQATDSAREAEVVSVVEAFHAALAAGDSLAALEQLHPDLLVFESGHAESLSEYRSGHLSADMGFAGATRREVTDQNVVLRGDVAMYTSVTSTTGTWREREIDATGAETMVLVRTAEGWRIRHIHWSSQ